MQKIPTALSTYFHLCFIFGTPSFQFIVVSINVSKSFKSIFAHRHLYSRKTEDLLPSETMIPLWTMLFLQHQQCHTGCDQGVGATSALSNQLEPPATTEVLLFTTIPPLQQLFTSLNSILVMPENWKRCSSIRVAKVGSLSANAKMATKFPSGVYGVVHILRNHFWGSRETPPPPV